jgi:hypothetical protein
LTNCDPLHSSHDIHQIKRAEWTNIETERILNRLHADKYLQKDSSNFWEVGPRGHLELRPLFELAINSSEETQQAKDERMLGLPQMLFY